MAVSSHALYVGALTPFLWAFEEREKLMEFYERVSGARMHASYIRPGGISYDLPADFISSVIDFIEKFIPRLDEVEELLTFNKTWKYRLVDVGSVTAEQAIDYSYSGVMLRSTGLNWDLRKDKPYEIYNSLTFSVPTSVGGDCFTRYLLRMAEMRESCKMIYQILNKIKRGPIKNEDFSISGFKNQIAASMENLISHYKLYSSGVFFNEGEEYTST